MTESKMKFDPRVEYVLRFMDKNSKEWTRSYGSASAAQGQITAIKNRRKNVDTDDLENGDLGYDKLYVLPYQVLKLTWEICDQEEFTIAKFHSYNVKLRKKSRAQKLKEKIAQLQEELEGIEPGDKS